MPHQTNAPKVCARSRAPRDEFNINVVSVSSGITPGCAVRRTAPRCVFTRTGRGFCVRTWLFINSAVGFLLCVLCGSDVCCTHSFVSFVVLVVYVVCACTYFQLFCAPHPHPLALVEYRIGALGKRSRAVAAVHERALILCCCHAKNNL